ncbi:GIY-YIG nuclease family protein [Candidatus Dojkabacteria bacterium]|nr:GIY-YIG nuclease family protein [Candidatus Dojkabacteria bacterium]
MYTIYILKCADRTLYTGIAKDLPARLATHKSGKGSKYVASRLPFRLVYTEKAKDRSTASKRELEIKQLSKQEKELLVNSTS